MAKRSPSKYEHMVDHLGRLIATGELPAGDVLNLAKLEVEFDVSRTVAREAMRYLESLGMITARRRVGLIVSDSSHWDVLDPKVILWRLEGPDRDNLLRSLFDLRIAVEPTAARLAAINATEQQRKRCLVLTERMRKYGEQGKGRSKGYLNADVEFHDMMLRASGNELLAAMEPAISALLIGRSEINLTPEYPSQRALYAHDALARAVADGDADEAERVCRAMVIAISSELL